MGIVDLDLLFQSPQKDARIIGGKGEEASSRGSTMEVNFVVKNTLKRWGRTPFYSGKQIWPLEEICANSVESSVGPAPEPDGPVPGPEN